MYLSRLELHGFKSFATRTVIDFAPGITVVVGPNGCGKSNVVDAVRWVIGEQRTRILRSSKMENVIFNGTARRRPLGMAEVLLTVENTHGVLPTEYTEVTLGRRLYRSGESEYLLNGVACRLRDITDLFMDTGMGAGAYSVIELKMIEDILSDNAQDRRSLFEEAAGITRYKLRRTQTLRKLDGTQVDLTRLRDLTEELDKRVQSLRRQAQKAERYKACETRLHELELALARVEYDRLAVQAETLTAGLRRLQDQMEAYNVRLSQAEAGLEVLRTRHLEREQTLVARQADLNAHHETVRGLEADLRLVAQRLETLARDLERTGREQQEANLLRAGHERTAECLAADLAEATPALDAAQVALETALGLREAARAEAAARQQDLAAARRREQQAADERAEHRRRLDRLTSRREMLEQDLARLHAQTAELKENAADLEARVHETARCREAARAGAADAREALEAAERDHAARADALEAAREARRRAERRHDAVAAEVQLLESLLASYEAFSEAVRFLAATPGWSPAPLRTVADVVGCEDDVRPALETALGDRAACLVVATEDEARQALARLADEDRGRATFLVLDRLRPTPTPPVPGFTALADKVRLLDADAAPAVAMLLQGWYLVDTFAAALDAAATHPGCFVAPDGTWVDGRGMLHGGGPHTAETGRLGRREQHRVASETLAHHAEDLARHTATVEAAVEALAAVPVAARRATLAAAEQALTRAEKEHDHAAYEREMLARRRAELADRIRTLEAERSTLDKAATPLAEALQAADAALAQARTTRAEAEAAFERAEERSREAFNHYGEAHVAAVEARNRHENLQRDLDRTRRTIADLTRRAEDCGTRLEQLRAEQAREQVRRDELEARIGTVQQGRQALDTAAATAGDALMETKAAISEQEAVLREIRREREQALREENQHAIRLAEIQTRTEDLLHSIEADFGLALRDIPVDVAAGFDEPAARDEVRDLRQKLRNMGPVNALALETYEEESARLDFMTTQLQDLEQAEATLLDTIREINTTASERFNRTFAAIRENFTRLFKDLFGEAADAEVSLADPNDVLESPIEILARPRGKRPSTLAQLSGGEKTLTAIALLFAIYLVKPSPFCILDEVDAPLDDANIGRFMNLIRSFSGATQFILVSHNKRTMEAADRMYGITMQEQGVSQLVGVRFDEAVELAEG